MRAWGNMVTRLLATSLDGKSAFESAGQRSPGCCLGIPVNDPDRNHSKHDCQENSRPLLRGEDEFEVDGSYSPRALPLALSF
jgi:hypothetical protein